MANSPKSDTEPLFGGHSIFQRLGQSSFGTFRRATEGLATLSLENFKLPKVVVIGGESVGKSSLLENITKCSIFPRSEKFCTRLPVRFIMESGENEGGQRVVEISYRNETCRMTSAKSVMAKMEAINAQIGQAIVEEEVVLRVREPNVPAFEFIDLPGIRCYPEQLAQTSLALARKYVSDPYTVALCVVDANSPSLASLQAVAILREAGKLNRTVIALTKTDTVHCSRLRSFVVDRVLRTAPEMHELPELRACVAVVNRGHNEGISLQDADVLEPNWFTQAFCENSSSPFAPELVQLAARFMTTSRLIEQLDVLYQEFISSDWKPRALVQLRSLREQAENEVAALGGTGHAAKESIVDILAGQICEQWPACEPRTSLFAGGTFHVDELSLPAPLPLQGAIDQGMLLWALWCSRAESAISAWLVHAVSTELCGLAEVTGVLGAAFDGQPPHRIERFEALKAELASWATAAFERHACGAHEKLRPKLPAAAEAVPSQLAGSVVKQFKRLWSVLVLAPVAADVLEWLSGRKEEADTAAIWQESEAYQQKRRESSALLTRIATAITIVEGIEKSMS